MSLEALRDWTGERIDIDNAGVTPRGGLSVVTDPGRSNVRAVARLVSLADTNDKPSADEALNTAAFTFTVTTSFDVPSFPPVEAGAPPTLQTSIPATLTSVRCGHGRTVGTAAADDAGCDALDVFVPPGVAADPEKPDRLEKRLFITARSGIGLVGVSIRNAVLGGLELHGSRGAIDVDVPATQGAVITIVAETGDDVVLRLPREFAADVVLLDTAGAIDTVAFPDVQSGKGRGQPGRGAKSISVYSARTGTAGRILLLAQ